MRTKERPDWLSWGLILVLFVLAALTAANMHVTLELADRIDRLPSKPIFQPKLPCGSVPTRFLLDYPECTQKLLDAMNVTNVRVLPKG